MGKAEIPRDGAARRDRAPSMPFVGHILDLPKGGANVVVSQELRHLRGDRLPSARPLGGCSDIYYDRRETISLGADDAVETNKVAHMVDPWPRYSANRNIAFNGERMQAAHRALSAQPRDPAGQRDHAARPPTRRRSRPRPRLPQ